MRRSQTLLGVLAVAGALAVAWLALPTGARANGCPLRFSQGTAGTPGDPIRIDTVADLQVLSASGSCYRSDYHFRQTADLALTGVWTPIGPVSGGFDGVYDGGGHVISGLFVDQTAVAAYKGLFGLLTSATVRDLTLSGGTVIGLSSNYGVLAGSASNSLIERVRIVNSSVSSTGSGNEYIGGVVGVAGDGTTIRDTHVSGLSVAIAGSSDHIGGITGAMYRSAAIERSSADVSISGTGAEVGGIVGLAYTGGRITDSFARGTVAGSTAVGGLLGRFRGCAESGGCGTITRSYSTTRVVATGSAGGLVALDGAPAASAAVVSFWDTLTSGQASSANGAIAKTTAEMTTLATFVDAGWSIGAGWDAGTTWGICAGANNRYPFLTAMYTVATETCTDRTTVPAAAPAVPAAPTAAGSPATTLPTRNARVSGNTIVTQVTLPSAGRVVQTGGIQEARAGHSDADGGHGEYGEYGEAYRSRATLMVACSTGRTVAAARVLTLRCPLNARTLKIVQRRGVVIRLVTSFTPITGPRLSSSLAVALPKRAARPSGSGTAPPVAG